MARGARLVVAGALLAALVALAAPARADAIVLVGGEVRRNVRVTDESATVVTFEPAEGGTPQTLPTARVRAVEHERMSDGFAAALECEAQGLLDDAASLYLEAARAPERAVAWERQTGLFRAATCRWRAGRAADGAELDRALLAALPQTRFRGDCLARLGRGALARGDRAGARATFEQLRQEGARAGLGLRWQLLAELLLQQLDEAADPDAALRSYVAFETRAAEFPEVQNQARLRAGRLRLARGEVDRALVFFRKVFAERAQLDDELAAGAANGLALALLAQPAPTPEDRTTALLALLRTVVLYGPRLGRHELVAEALVNAARELLRRGDAEEVARAREFLARCVAEYPGTGFAAQAEALR